MNNYVEYEVLIDGLVLKDDIELSGFSGCNNITRLGTNERGNLVVTIPVSVEILREKDAVAVAEPILENLLDLIALERCSYIGHPFIHQIVIKDRHYTQNDLPIECLINTPADELASLQKTLEKSKFANSGYLRLYRNIVLFALTGRSSFCPSMGVVICVWRSRAGVPNAKLLGYISK